MAYRKSSVYISGIKAHQFWNAPPSVRDF